jgi:thioredoxin-like negative regulator of GroEL
MPSSKAHLVIRTKQDSVQAENTIKSQKPVLILYHAHWCPHCVDFVGPQYEPSRPWQQICDMVKKTYKGKVICMEVEESNMGVLPEGLNQIRGYPTLMLIQQNGGMTEYQGARDNVNEIKSFIEQNTGIKGGAIRKRTTTSSAVVTKTKEKETKGGQKETKKRTTKSKKDTK